MSENVFWVITMRIKPGELENFRGVMNDLVDATRTNESNAIHYEWFISDDETQCHIYERYADSAAVMMHVKNFGHFAERFMAAVEVTGMTVYGNPNDEVTEAAKGFGAVFMAPFGGFAR